MHFGKEISRWVVSACLAVVVATGAIANGEEPAGLERTVLDRYVAAPDDHYQWELVNTVKENGVTMYVIDMVSQKWLTEKEVNKPIWRHWLTITVPNTLESDIGFLFIGGGSNGRDAPDKISQLDAMIAKNSRTPFAQLYQVPNQPLIFVGDETIERSEDSAIAYTWDKYLRTGDEKWPMRLPMTKSAVRAMDTVSAFMASDAGGKHKVNRYAVAGGSKRGWTTWTTAIVDKRVVAIAPIVIDLLNVVESFKHHYSAYGFFAEAVGDYERMGVMNWQDTDEYANLMKIVEPYEYRDRLTLPKFVLNATGDQFFLPDSWQYYWDGLSGEKYLRYLPNTDHGLDGSDVAQSVIAWYHSIVHNVTRPRFSWDIDENGTIKVITLDEPTSVKLWSATNPETRNFQLKTIGKAWTSTELQPVDDGVYMAEMVEPPQGYTAYMVELTYPSGTMMAPFKFTTGVKVVPDVKPFELPVVTDEERLKEPAHP